VVAVRIINAERKKLIIKLTIIYKTMVFLSERFFILSIYIPSPILFQYIHAAYID